ncbi:mitogen-activated protein kinase kinase kinase 20-like [Juglans microcarpa x Juglans regia]|uniref:mitogen-activated protein kinase kinase kinase 20-like n=1 Tax=Juglans microcarpa x Juglans regia TaxID=2249226 RepID=UPI001B7DAA2B|nr:mitogen-activated protein kinase kinase kinase 20-like [Juglans microcarpa x Juglans regia]
MKWQKDRVLGSGSFGTVYLGVPTNPYIEPAYIAIKTSSLGSSSTLQKERRILSRFVGCPEIVRCLGAELSRECGLYYYNLLLEYASGGTLQDLINGSGGKLEEHDVRRYTRMILKGLLSLHEQGYVHCDLKPANILVFSTSMGVSEVKITDFGLAKIPGEENEFMRKRFSFRGTPYYMSPESVLLGIITPSLDIWSLGCVVVEMVTGNVAWDSSLSTDELMVEIACGDPTNIPETMSELGKDFLRGCFERNPLKRLTAEKLLLHPFLVEGSQGSPSAGSALGCSSFNETLCFKKLSSSSTRVFMNTNKPPSPEKRPPPTSWLQATNTNCMFTIPAFDRPMKQSSIIRPYRLFPS